MFHTLCILTISGPFISNSNAENFSTYRKQRIGLSVSVHNLAQIKAAANYDTYLNALHNRIIMPGLSYEECNFWQKDFGVERMWVDVQHSNDDSSIESIMKEDTKNAKLKWVDIISAGDMYVMPFKTIAFRVRNAKGRYTSGMGTVDFIDKKHYSGYNIKQYDFLKANKKTNNLVSKLMGTQKQEEYDPNRKVHNHPTSFEDDDLDILNNNEVNIDPVKYIK